MKRFFPTSYRFIKILVVPVLSLIAISCSPLTKVNEILTAKRFNQERNAQDRVVEEKDSLFENLLRDVKDNRLVLGLHQSDIKEKYGTPQFEKALKGSSSEKEVWMYRYFTVYSNTDKVYLYFDEKGFLTRMKVEPPHKKH